MNQPPYKDPCPICGTTKRAYLFEIHGSSVTSCAECGLTFSSLFALSHEHENERFSIRLDDTKTKHELPEGKTELEAGKKYLQILAKLSPDTRNLLLIAEPGHYFAALARDFADDEEQGDVLQQCDGPTCTRLVRDHEAARNRAGLTRPEIRRLNHVSSPLIGV